MLFLLDSVWGTADLAVPTLRALQGKPAGHRIRAVYTREGQKAGEGEGLKLQGRSPVELERASHNSFACELPRRTLKNTRKRLEQFRVHGPPMLP